MRRIPRAKRRNNRIIFNAIIAAEKSVAILFCVYFVVILCGCGDFVF